MRSVIVFLEVRQNSFVELTNDKCENKKRDCWKEWGKVVDVRCWRNHVGEISLEGNDQSTGGLKGRNSKEFEDRKRKQKRNNRRRIIMNV